MSHIKFEYQRNQYKNIGFVEEKQAILEQNELLSPVQVEDPKIIKNYLPNILSAKKLGK